MTKILDSAGQAGAITPPMRSAGAVAFERFMLDRGVRGCEDRDALVRAIYSAMDAERRPRYENPQSKLSERAALLLR